MRKIQISAAVLHCLFLCSIVFAQTGNASLGGTVSDSTKALIPGVTITATNDETGVASTAITNDNGIYNFPSLQPGKSYSVAAALTGFQTKVYKEVVLGTAQQVRQNFILQVGGLGNTVDVGIPIDNLLAASSSTVGEVLPDYKVRDLPLVGNNVLDLVNILSGVRLVPNATYGELTTFAGISAGATNTTRDGISVNDGRYDNGVFSVTQINPELVGEIRLILAPVDAELGRGNGQVQIQTRSGTNKYTGSATWSVRNSALDANTWTNNRTVPRVVPDYSNRHEYTVAYGGPIIKNKTFFFVLFNGQTQLSRNTVSATVLTDTARQGIFRYYDGWRNGNANQVTNATGTNPVIAVVDVFGNPKQPATAPNGSTFAGALRCFNVFGPDSNCDGVKDNTTSWDTLRPSIDPTGYIAKIIQKMPRANAFDGGDGLNTAIFRWTRRSIGAGGIAASSLQGIDPAQNRKQINLKVDHNFSPRQKLSVNFTDEWDHSDSDVSPWPGGYSGATNRNPFVITGNFASTLSANLFNEARFGLRRSYGKVIPPWFSPDEKLRTAASSFLMDGGLGFPVIVGAGSGTLAAFQSGVMLNTAQTSGQSTPLWTYADTLSWARGKHAFKGGVEIRLSRTSGYNNRPNNVIPKAIGGPGNNTFAGFSQTSTFTGLTSTNNQTAMADLLYFLSGSVQSITQMYFMQFGTKLDDWENYLTYPRKTRDFHQNEFDIFFKDDWKVKPSLTLNLGLRYEYYGVPFVSTGLTVAPIGGGDALFGISGRGFDSWMNPGPVGYDPSLLTTLEFVGPNSKNPGKRLYKDDWNNFGPAVGFAWQVPWFGENKTTVRGGYQLTFPGGGHGFDIDNAVGGAPGSLYSAILNGAATDGSYLDLTKLKTETPVVPQVKPMQPIPIYERTQTFEAFDPNYTTPYVQNFTLSVTRVINRQISVDLRYVGTKGTKLYSAFDLNAENFLYNGLKEALDITRAGGDAPMFDAMLKGLNLNPGVTGFGPVGTVVAGVLQTGSMHLRNSATFRANIANGNYQAVAASLNTNNGPTGSGLPALPATLGTVSGRLLRNSGLFPENFIATNPQFANAILHTNANKSTYHSLQTQFTLRPVQGINVQTTYTFSKGMGMPVAQAAGGATSYTDPTDRNADYSLQATDRRHELRTNGGLELPIGPNKLFFGNSSGILAGFIEHWNMNFIYNLSSGAPLSIGANNTLYANGVADIVGPFPRGIGHVNWTDGALAGNYFGDASIKLVPDPQCTAVTTKQALNTFCTLDSVADANTGQILLQNPLPGKRGSLGQRTVFGPSQWQFDGSMSKTFRIRESVGVQFRVDATNVLNHPQPANPFLTINDTTAAFFGQVTSKTGNRNFQGQIRLSF